MSTLATFPLMVKSTLDGVIFTLANSLNTDVFDLNGDYMNPEKAASQMPALAWSMESMSPAPLDPYYDLHFEVNAKTAQDIAQYLSLQLTSAIGNCFRVGTSFPVFDQTQPTEGTQQLGVIQIVGNHMTPSGFDEVASFRPVSISAKAFRFK